MFLRDLKEFKLPEVEGKVLEFWKKNKIFEKSLENRKGGRRFVFFEGPPTANGRPGIHHVLARVFKDVILRYKTMRGFYVPRRAGWDTHGLPVEIQVEKELGLKSKKEIEEFGIAEFNKKCQESVWKYKNEFERLTERMGFWLDMKNPYVTYEKNYIETLWWIIAQFWKKKLLYKGNRIVNWCPRCGTGLSSHEMSLGYKEVTDDSVYVKFKLKKGQQITRDFKTNDKTYILSWTTTPWTLPGNVALAVGEKINYVVEKINLKIPDKEKRIEDGDIFIWTVGANIGIFENAGFPNEGLTSNILTDIKGKDLVGLSYEPLFEVKALQGNPSTRAARSGPYRVYAADFVTTTDGTGVVHTAVMYGEDDYKLGVKVGLPQHHTVDEAGKFTKDIKGLTGLFVKSKETEKKIFGHLEKNKNLLKIEQYKHEYPHCWRCGTPLLYYARSSWFVAMSKLKKQLIANNQKINWVPEHIKNGRFGEWLRDIKDWNFSRERYWGTPLPIWECKKCGHTEAVEGLEDLNKKASLSTSLKAGGGRNEYLLMRHGESETQLLGISDYGKGKYHLTDKGTQQVIRLAELLKKEKIDIVFASPVLRTQETTKITAKVLGIKKINFDLRLKDINTGVFSERPEREYHKFLPTFEDKFLKTPEKGENLKDLRARLWDFISEVEKKYKDKKILVVSHEYPIWMLSQAMTGWTQGEAISEKERRGKDFIKVGQCEKVNFKCVPRDETGEVDLHRPYIDEVKLKCQKCGGEARRVKELADVWFDSGSMPFAQIHHPFSKEKLEFPADYISEAVDQTRGWFYTLLAVATALGEGEPYKNVICLGHINDKYGQKMSKSKGNVVDPWVMAEKYGMDAVRWYFYTATPPGEPKNFDEQEILKTYRRLHLILWNSLVFYKTYAEKKPKIINHESKAENILDQWILMRLKETIKKATKFFDAYQVREAALEIEKLVDDLSRWYIRRSRRRLQKPENNKDFEACSATLGYVLASVLKMIAPFNPFFAEILWNVLGENNSVHVEDWPAAIKVRASDTRLISEMEKVRSLAAFGLAKRAEMGVRVRQPLLEMRIKTKFSYTQLFQVLQDEVNVKKVVSDSKIKDEVWLDGTITQELKEEGLLRELIRAVQDLRQKAGLTPQTTVALMLALPDVLKDTVLKNEVVLKKEVGAKVISYGRPEKFEAEVITKMDEGEVWVGVRKVK